MNNPIHALKERFPYQFQNNIGIGVARGWAEAFAKLCEAIDEVTIRDPKGQHYGFYWRQVKEKFGTARLYYRMDGVGHALRVDMIDEDGQVISLHRSAKPARSADTGPHEKVAALIEAAELWMRGVCIICGDPRAQLDKTGGYVLNLCAHHAQQRRVDRMSMDSPWFED